MRRGRKQDDDGMPPVPGDKPPGCGCVSVLLIVVFGLSIALVLAIRAQQPDRDADGALTESGPLSVGALQVGDCVQVDPTVDTIQGMAAAPCTLPHDAQVYATGALDEGDYPGDEAVSAQVSDRCEDRLAGVQGGDGYDVLLLQPVVEAWPASRGYACLLRNPDGSRLTEQVGATAVSS